MSSPIKVWLDDLREAPDGWLHARTAHEAIALLESGRVTQISLDHDLGDDEKHGTGMQRAFESIERLRARHERE